MRQEEIFVSSWEKPVKSKASHHIMRSEQVFSSLKNVDGCVPFSEASRKSQRSGWEDKSIYEKMYRKDEYFWERHMRKGGTVSWKAQFCITILIKWRVTQRHPRKLKLSACTCFFSLPMHWLQLHTTYPLLSSEDAHVLNRSVIIFLGSSRQF